jgi:hypothetical protein
MRWKSNRQLSYYDRHGPKAGPASRWRKRASSPSRKRASQALSNTSSPGSLTQVLQRSVARYQPSSAGGGSAPGEMGWSLPRWRVRTVCLICAVLSTGTSSSKPTFHASSKFNIRANSFAAAATEVSCPTNTYLWGSYKGKPYCVKCPASKFSSGCSNCKADPHAAKCIAAQGGGAVSTVRVVSRAHPTLHHHTPRPSPTPAPTPKVFCMRFEDHTCPGGKYQNQANTGKCTKCPVGKWQYASGKCDCKKCGRGLFQPFAGMTACYSCPIGT